MRIRLEDKNMELPEGNFEFVREKTGDERIWQCFLAFESHYRTNFTDFAHKLRIAFEEISVFLEMQYLRSHKEDRGLSDEKLGARIRRDCQDSNSSLTILGKPGYYNYKNLILRYVSQDTDRYIPVLTHYGYDKSRKSFYNMKDYLYDLYAFGSSSSHGGGTEWNSKTANRMLRSFHDFLGVLFSSKHRFSSFMMPVADYFPIPEKVLKNKGLSLTPKQQLYVKKEKDGSIKTAKDGNVRGFYLGVLENRETSLSDERQEEAVDRLWNGYEDPANVIRCSAEIKGSVKNTVYRFYEFNSFPCSMSRTLLLPLNETEKEQVMQGMLRAVKSLHHCEPPVYHRSLRPEVFLVMRMQRGLKAVLYDFSTSKKDSQDEDADGRTMFVNLTQLTEDADAEDFYPPEIRKPFVNKAEIAWDKVDIFSLGQLLIYTLSGYLSMGEKDGENILQGVLLHEKKKKMILQMLSQEPDRRPEIGEVCKVFSTEEA